MGANDIFRETLSNELLVMMTGDDEELCGISFVTVPVLLARVLHGRVDDDARNGDKRLRHFHAVPRDGEDLRSDSEELASFG